MAELYDKYERALKGEGARRGRVKIAGAGKVAGGAYEVVSIAGSGTVDGDVDAEEIRASGSASFHGNVNARELSLAGSAKVHGDVKAGAVRVAGSFSVEGAIEAESVRVAGALRAKRVHAASVRLSGAFNVEGEVEGDSIELRLSNGSRASLVKGVEVSIRKAEEKSLSILKLLKRVRTPELRVGKVEAKVVTIEDVIVKGDVKAEKVELVGSGRIEGRVEGELVRR